MANRFGTVVDGGGQNCWGRPTHNHGLFEARRASVHGRYRLPALARDRHVLAAHYVPVLKSNRPAFAITSTRHGRQLDPDLDRASDGTIVPKGVHADHRNALSWSSNHSAGRMTAWAP